MQTILRSLFRNTINELRLNRIRFHWVNYVLLLLSLVAATSSRASLLLLARELLSILRLIM